MENRIQRVGLVGAGNVATLLGQELIRIGFSIECVHSKSAENKRKLAELLNSKIVHQLSDFSNCDIIICAVPDQVMLETVRTFSEFAPTVSVSGTVDIGVCKGNFPIGVLYPLQTFSKGISVNWSEIPFFIESSSVSFQNELTTFAGTISTTVVPLNAVQRLQLHIAAVFINNFTNHMVTLGQEQLTRHQMNYNWLKPLLQQTVTKLNYTSAREAQTGPARRNDTLTLQNHLNALPEELHNLYTTISASIRKMYQQHD